MHYYLAAREAQAKTDGAYGLLLHEDGTISETPTANVLVLARGTLWSPPIQRVLPGISLNYASRLANQLGINFAYRDLTREDLIEADEVMLSSTSTCLLPVTMFDGDPVGSGQVGATFRRLIAAWSDAVGVDITAAS
jgi:branched-subunit amino acid aminotransferase/4-amino-4-deoxychorismate lyase